MKPTNRTDRPFVGKIDFGSAATLKSVYRNCIPLNYACNFLNAVAKTKVGHKAFFGRYITDFVLQYAG